MKLAKLKSMTATAVWVIVHSAVFCLAFVGTIATYYMLFVPVVLIGLPIAIFAKSELAKSVAITVVIGSLVWIPIYLVTKLF